MLLCVPPGPTQYIGYFIRLWHDMAYSLYCDCLLFCALEILLLAYLLCALKVPLNADKTNRRKQAPLYALVTTTIRPEFDAVRLRLTSNNNRIAVELFKRPWNGTWSWIVVVVTGHFFEGSFVRNGVVQIPKFDAKSLNLTLNLTICLYVSGKWPFGQVNCPRGGKHRRMWWKNVVISKSAAEHAVHSVCPSADQLHKFRMDFDLG